MKSIKTYDLFPNPFRNEFSLKLSYDGTIEVIDMLGNLIRREEMHKDEQKLLTLNIASGIYLLKIIAGEKTSVHRIVCSK